MIAQTAINGPPIKKDALWWHWRLETAYGIDNLDELMMLLYKKSNDARATFFIPCAPADSDLLELECLFPSTDLLGLKCFA